MTTPPCTSLAGTHSLYHPHPPPHTRTHTCQQEAINLPKGTSIDLAALLPDDLSYAVYEGSLTTPPCTQGVIWHVMLSPLRITQQQVCAQQVYVCWGGGAAAFLHAHALHAFALHLPLT